MKRRDFIGLVGGAAAASWPLAAPAQQTRRVGVLLNTSENDDESKARILAFQASLEKQGWIIGRNIQVDYRWYRGETERAQLAAAELLALAPDVIVANANTATGVLQALTQTVPIVFVVVQDPVRSNYVQSLAKPGGNITGFANQPVEGAKFVELLKEFAPEVKHVSVMTGYSPSADALYSSAQTAAEKLSISTTRIVVREPSVIEPALTVLRENPHGGLIIPGDTVTSTNRQLIIKLAAAYLIPAVYGFRFFAVDGGLASYGIDIIEQFQQAAGYVDRILKGEKPADLPVQQPTRFTLVINLKAAKALGLTVPPSMLTRADEVIE
jgi:putative tryptophan/tyrosine transport system substrate-binding protein